MFFEALFKVCMIKLTQECHWYLKSVWYWFLRWKTNKSHIIYIFLNNTGELKSQYNKNIVLTILFSISNQLTRQYSRRFFQIFTIIRDSIFL